MQARYMTTAQFAELAGIGLRAAKLAARKGRNGQTWRGVVLDIRSSHGPGGAAGRRNLIRVDSLPIDLQRRASATWSDAPPVVCPLCGSSLLGDQ